MSLPIPRLLGEVHDKDTQFTAAVKQNQELVLIGGVIAVILIIFVVHSSMPQTRQGTWRYGVCKVFLERLSEYPSNLKILTVAEKQNAAQIGYISTNSYGSQESELIECFYNTAGHKVEVNRVTINRKPLALEKSIQTENSQSGPITDYKQVFALFEDGRREMANKKYIDITLDKFNETIPVIMAREDLDLTMPPPLSFNIPDLKYN